jgi:transcriptional regulator with XRE-family HTH domain
MEFNEKLQELRKQKGLTQEEFAETLFVSRAAVSKWESGRGYPGIDSLKAIAKFFGITIDELLSGDELLILAKEEAEEKAKHFRDLVFGLLDLSIAMFFFLPFFGQRANGVICEVSLLSLTETAPYLKTSYIVIVIAIIIMGVLTLALQNCRCFLWTKNKHILSIALSVVGVCLFIISQQPYAAVFTFVFLMIKAFLLMKRR